MDMSKTPVRDAIQKLVDEKRIDILSSRGIRLHKITKEELMQHYNFGEYFDLDQQFHQELLESLRDPYFSNLQHSSMGFYNHPEIQFTDNKLSRKEVYECHRKILNAICEGDSPGAYEALLEHADLMLKSF